MNKFIILMSTLINFLCTTIAFAVDNPIKNINEGSYTDTKCNQIGEGFFSFEGGRLYGLDMVCHFVDYKNKILYVDCFDEDDEKFSREYYFQILSKTSFNLALIHEGKKLKTSTFHYCSTEDMKRK